MRNNKNTTHETALKIKETKDFLRISRITSDLYKDLANSAQEAYLSMENFINSKDGDFAHLAEAHEALKIASQKIEKNQEIVDACIKVVNGNG